MDMTLSMSLYQKKEELAQAGTLLMGILVFTLMQTMVMQQDTHVAEKQISLTFMPPAIAPEKIIPQRIMQQSVPVIDVPEQMHIAAPVALDPPQEHADTPSVKPSQTRANNSGAELAFAQDVRNKIERRKVYPDTARDLGMEGEVEVLYELDRSGNLLHAEIAVSSGYKLLDQAALKAVKSATYKGFPDDAWTGSGSKEFRTKLVFLINQ